MEEMKMKNYIAPRIEIMQMPREDVILTSYIDLPWMPTDNASYSRDSFNLKVMKPINEDLYEK